MPPESAPPQDHDYPPVTVASVVGAVRTENADCGDRHVFPRDKFAQVARAEVWCNKPAGHEGAHEAIKNGSAFVWGAVLGLGLQPETSEQ